MHGTSLRASRPCGLPHMSPPAHAAAAAAAAGSSAGSALLQRRVLGGGHTFQSNPDPSGDDPAVTSNYSTTIPKLEP